jgi:Fe2+ transport system protein FeoA
VVDYWCRDKSITRSRAILAFYQDFRREMSLSHRNASELHPNESGRIIRFEDLIIAGKLMAMGILPHAQIEMVRRNALGQTLIYRINSRLK